LARARHAEEERAGCRKPPSRHPTTPRQRLPLLVCSANYHGFAQYTADDERSAPGFLMRSKVNPHPNPHNAMSYTTSANFGSPRGLLSRCKTYPG